MAELSSRFRPGSRQRGEDTRRRILDAALELFAADGFDGASTRTIAEHAGVNLPAIQYYFGSKEGLYRAVVEEIIEHMEAGVVPLAESTLRKLDSGQLSRRQLVELLCSMLDTVIVLMLDESVPNREARQKFFARMEAEPNPALDALQDSVMRHVCGPCAAIVGVLMDRPADDERVLVRVMALIGQAKIFCGWGVPRVLHWHTIGENRVRLVQTVIREHVQAIFHGTSGR